MRLAIKIGGSISVDDRGPRADYIKSLIEVINSLDLEKLIVGIGGGKLARNYLSSMGSLLTPHQKELVIIELLRANVRMLSFLLNGRAILTEESLEDPGEVPEEKTLVIGGICPGRSTDANTALLAEAIGADLFVKLTDVEGVFTADPDRDRNAKLVRRMTYNELRSLSVDGGPGSYGVLDRLAIEVLDRADISTRVLNGKDPSILIKLLEGEDLGTLISRAGD